MVVYIKKMLGLALVSGQLKVFCIRVSHLWKFSCAFRFYLYLLAPLRWTHLLNRSVSSICWRSCYFTFFDCMFRWLYSSVLLRWCFLTCSGCNTNEVFLSSYVAFFPSQPWKSARAFFIMGIRPSAIKQNAPIMNWNFDSHITTNLVYLSENFNRSNFFALKKI